MCVLEFGPHKENKRRGTSCHTGTGKVITVTNLYTYSVIAANFLDKHPNLFNFDQCVLLEKIFPALINVQKTDK